MEELRSEIRKYVLQNAVQYGKPPKHSVIMKRILAEHPELRIKMKKINISNNLEEYLQRESNARNITTEEYIWLMINSINYSQRMFKQLGSKGTDLKLYYETNKDRFIYYMSKVRDIVDESIRVYIWAIEKHISSIFTPEDLKVNMDIGHTKNYANGIRILFEFMKFESEDEFNGIPIDKWKSVIKNRSTKTDESYDSTYVEKI